MSGWDAYITNLHASSGAIKRSAIFGYPAGDVWARSAEPAFAATDAELTTLAKAFDDLSQLPAKGADLEGVHYIVPRTEENLVFGKKDKAGFFAVKTKSAILVAIYEGDGHSASTEVRGAVEKLADYLKNAGY